jgi:nucleotide-binding universal stress UspA family protein
MRYKKIIVPLDGSEQSERAIAHAVSLAQEHGGSLSLVRVVDFASELAGEFSAVAYNSTLERLTEETEEYLEEKKRVLAGQGVQVTTILKLGPPAKRILEAVEESNADLLVMSSHGRSGLSRWFMGSTAEDVMRRSTVPTLLLPRDPQPE